MGKECCSSECNIDVKQVNHNFKKVLWAALILNFSMFILENIQSLLSHSLALRADAIDFLGDSANYFMTLFVLNSNLKTKAKVSLLKASFMFSFGLWILIEAFLKFFNDSVPNSFTMTWVGGLAFIVNASVAYMLYKYKDGDSNMQSVWLCSRNDAISNLIVILASIGVYYFSASWPDLIVGVTMAFLSITSAIKVFKVARVEIKS